MAKNQKHYTQEFKQQIVDLYNVGGKSMPQLQGEYGINKSTICTWVKQAYSHKSLCDTETISMKEYKALQKELHDLKIENEILKKLQP